MPPTDDPTLAYYDTHAADYCAATRQVDLSALYTPFLAEVATGGRVLDAGCGCGRDARAFIARGYALDAFDASAAMVTEARRYTGLGADRVWHMRFADLKAESRYDGVWACASLLHLPAASQPDALRRLLRALVPGGLLFLSYKAGAGEARDAQGRHFTYYDPESLRGLLNMLDITQVLRVWSTPDASRAEVTWVNGLVRR